MPVVTICSDFGSQKKKSVTPSTFSPSIYQAVMGPDAMIIGFCSCFFFLILSFKPALSLYSFTPIKRLFNSSSISAIIVISSTYLRLLMFLPHILISAYNSSSLAFLMMCSAYLLNKQGDNRQPYHTPLLILNPSVVPYRVLNVASWPKYRFLRRQVRWSGIPISKSFPQFVMIHTVKGFSIVN